MSSKVNVQWNIHGHLFTFIVLFHCWHEVDGWCGITTTGLPHAMFVQPAKTSRVAETASGQYIFGCRLFLSCFLNSIWVVTASCGSVKETGPSLETMVALVVVNFNSQKSFKKIFWNKYIVSSEISSTKFSHIVIATWSFSS